MEPSPCALCGHPDHRHRTWDAILARFLMGERLHAIRLDYEIGWTALEDHLRAAIREKVSPPRSSKRVKANRSKTR